MRCRHCPTPRSRRRLAAGPALGKALLPAPPAAPSADPPRDSCCRLLQQVIRVLRENDGGPTGEATGRALKLDFDRRLRLRFRGSVITSDAGLLASRELDDALGLTASADKMLADCAHRQDGWHALVGFLPRSVSGLQLTLRLSQAGDNLLSLPFWPAQTHLLRFSKLLSLLVYARPVAPILFGGYRITSPAQKSRGCAQEGGR